MVTDDGLAKRRQGLRLVTALVLAAIGIFVTISLGNWQTRRGVQKQALQAQWDALERQAPKWIDAPDLISMLDRLPARVRLAGTWSADRAVWLQNRALDGRAGFWLVMPFVVASDTVVLVQRGWVPRDPSDRERLPPVQTPPRIEVIEGVALSQLPRLLDLGGTIEKGPLPAIWQNMDFDAYEHASGLKVVRFVIQQTDPDGGGLERRWPRPAIDIDKHRGYAFQWYALACLIAFLTVAFGLRPWFQSALVGRWPRSRR